MKAITYDLEYLCQKMSDMSGLPVRIYKNNRLDKTFSVFKLVKDPVVLHLSELLQLKDHVAYFITPDFDYYGIMNIEDTKIILGPSKQGVPSMQHIHDLAYQLNVSSQDFPAFRDSMMSIVPMPLDSLIQMMCTLNHVFNQEKLSLSDFQIKGQDKSKLYFYGETAQPSDIYRNLQVEQQLKDIVSAGDDELLQKWVSEVPTVRSGNLADTFIRQHRNTFIVSTTLVSRTAIEAGMNAEDAFKMSDSFIQQCENAQSVDEINKLQYEMVLGYTKAVNALKKMTDDSGLKADIYYYVIHHISEPVTTSEIADSLYMSRSHLSTTFRKKYGEELSSYIHRIKMDRAMELIKDKSKSITQISDYLGYSSPSHFNRVFRQYCHLKPSEYRKLEA